MTMPALHRMPDHQRVFSFSQSEYNLPLRSDHFMPIPQSRVRDLLDSALRLKRMIDEMREFAERTLADPSADGRALAIMIAELNIPDDVIETLAAERKHIAMTWNRNESNRRSLRRRRAGESANTTVVDFDE